MKEMVYKNKWETELLDSGVYDGYEYAIVSRGTHPCAYVKLPHGHKYYGVDYADIPVECHWGLTYSDNRLDVLPLRSGWWIGWDYAHGYDHMEFFNGKKWTTAEILDEVKDVIRQVKELHEAVSKIISSGLIDENDARRAVYLAKYRNINEIKIKDSYNSEKAQTALLNIIQKMNRAEVKE
ncbi:MAG: hypothetical protein NC177_07640 [Ruminococcus flavefaciens]|nr:hypothetical protein [Ruminococcus flavefaciens]